MRRRTSGASPAPRGKGGASASPLQDSAESDALRTLVLDSSILDRLPRSRNPPARFRLQHAMN
jgi:hypothetical protein